MAYVLLLATSWDVVVAGARRRAAKREEDEVAARRSWWVVRVGNIVMPGASRRESSRFRKVGDDEIPCRGEVPASRAPVKSVSRRKSRSGIQKTQLNAEWSVGGSSQSEVVRSEGGGLGTGGSLHCVGIGRGKKLARAG